MTASMVVECPHPRVEDSRCEVCGACVHDVVLNGICVYCGETDIRVTVKPDDVVPADRLKKPKR